MHLVCVIFVQISLGDKSMITMYQSQLFPQVFNPFLYGFNLAYFPE